MDAADQLEHTLRALRTVAGASFEDALGQKVDGFLRDLPVARISAAGVAILRASIDDWLAKMVGPLLGRVETLLAGPDLQHLPKLREVLRALWILLDGSSGDARATLAEVGTLLTASLEREDRAGARMAVAAARAWLATHEWVVVASVGRTR